MKEWLAKYKKYVEQGIFLLIMIVLVFGIYTLFKNGKIITQVVTSGTGRFLDVISPIIYAFALAYILYRPMKFIEGKLTTLINKCCKDKSFKGIELGVRLLSIVIVFVIVGASLMLLIHFLVPPIVENVQKLLRSNLQLGEPFKAALLELNHTLENAKSDFNVLIQSKDFILTLAGYVGKVIGNLGGAVIDFVATLILTFYFLKDKERLFKAMNRFGDVIFSPKIKKYVHVVLGDIDEIIGGFIVGTLLAGIIVGVISTALMLMIGHPFAVLIGTVAGITNMIPYVGPLVGAVLALVLGLLDSVSLGVTGCILLLLYQQIDGNFIEPKVVGDKIGLPPVWILIVVIIGGSYYGGMGMILSAPVAALIKIYIDRIYEYKKNRASQ